MRPIAQPGNIIRTEITAEYYEKRKRETENWFTGLFMLENINYAMGLTGWGMFAWGKNRQIIIGVGLLSY